MRRIVAAVLALGTLAWGFPCLGATKSSKGKPLVTVVTDTTVAAKGGGISVLVGDVRRRLENRMNLHLLNPAEVRAAVESAIEEELREGLVIKAIREKGYDRELEPEVRVIRNRFIANDYRQRSLVSELRATDNEVLERSPKIWVETRFREITLPTAEEAEQVRQELLKDPGRFVELVREKSVGPKVDQDGLTFFIRPLPFNFIFPQEDNDHIFSLKKGEISRIIRSGLGFTIYQPVESREIPPEEVRDKKRKLAVKILDEKVVKRIAEVQGKVKPLNLFEEDEGKVYQMVLDHLAKRKADRTEVVRIGDLSLSFYTLTRLEKLWTWAKPNLTDPVEYMDRLRQMVRQLILPEALLSIDAKDHGFLLGERDAGFADAKVESWLKDRLFEERIASVAQVSEEETRQRYEASRETLRRWKKVDYRVIRTKSLDKIQSVFKRIQEGEGDFEKGFRFAANQKINQEEGGGIYRGVSWDNVPMLVRQVLPRLKEGTFSTILKNPDGYSVIILDRVRDWDDPPYEQVRNDLQSALKAEKTKKALDGFFAENFPDLKIEKNPDAVDSLVAKIAEIMEGSLRRLQQKGAPPGHGGSKGGH